MRSPMPSSLPSSVVLHAGRRSAARATSRVEYCSISCARRTLGHDLGLVHDDQPVAQLLGLVHVVRGEHERHALLLEPVQAVPEQVARLRVEAGRRLVEQQQVGLVDQRAGDRQPPLHAARQRVDDGPCAGRSAGRSRAARRRARGSRRAAGRSSGRRSSGCPRPSARCRGCPPAARRRAGRGSSSRRVAGPCRARAARRRCAATRSRSCASSTSCRRRWGRGSRTPRRAATAKSMPSTATNSPKRLVRPWA